MKLIFPTLQDLELHNLPLPQHDEIHIFFIPAEDTGKMHKKGTSRLLVKQIASSYLCLPKEDLSIKEELHGKPYLILPENTPCQVNLYFNLSHTTGYMVIAFATAMQLGIDIERSDRIVHIKTISRHFFYEKEANILSGSAEGGNETKHFIALWTLKEAFLKGLGTGLTVSPSSFMLLPDGNQYKIRCDNHELQSEYHPWILQHVPAPDGYTCSIAFKELH